jgi:hypothetical protein
MTSNAPLRDFLRQSFLARTGFVIASLLVIVALLAP